MEKDQQFNFLMSLKFLFSISRVILLVCIFFTYDENIFSGLNFSTERNDAEYIKARAVYFK